jgi:hypothetical protein
MYYVQVFGCRQDEAHTHWYIHTGTVGVVMCLMAAFAPPHKLNRYLQISKGNLFRVRLIHHSPSSLHPRSHRFGYPKPFTTWLPPRCGLGNRSPIAISTFVGFGELLLVSHLPVRRFIPPPLIGTPVPHAHRSTRKRFRPLARPGSPPDQPAGPLTGVLLPRRSVAGRAEFDP